MEQWMVLLGLLRVAILHFPSYGVMVRQLLLLLVLDQVRIRLQ